MHNWPSGHPWTGQVGTHWGTPELARLALGTLSSDARAFGHWLFLDFTRFGEQHLRVVCPSCLSCSPPPCNPWKSRNKSQILTGNRTQNLENQGKQISNPHWELNPEPWAWRGRLLPTWTSMHNKAKLCEQDYPLPMESLIEWFSQIKLNSHRPRYLEHLNLWIRETWKKELYFSMCSGYYSINSQAPLTFTIMWNFRQK